VGFIFMFARRPARKGRCIIGADRSPVHSNLRVGAQQTPAVRSPITCNGCRDATVILTQSATTPPDRHANVFQPLLGVARQGIVTSSLKRPSYRPTETATYASRWLTRFSRERSVSTFTRTRPAVCPLRKPVSRGWRHERRGSAA